MHHLLRFDEVDPTEAAVLDAGLIIVFVVDDAGDPADDRALLVPGQPVPAFTGFECLVFFACQGVHVCADQLGNVVFVPSIELVGKTGEAPQILFGSNFLDGNSHGSSVNEYAKVQKKNEMLPIVDKPTIQYIVEEAVASGIEDILIVTGRGKRAIEDHFDVHYELEAELEQRGKTELLTELRNILRYTGVSDVKMEEGSLRCDVNINVKNTETGQRTAITEVKNLNSFRAVSRAIESETQRHIALLEAEETGEKETRRWDDLSGRTLLMRAKGTSSDYRYSAEGDIPRIQLPAQMIEEIQRALPEMPHVKKARFQNEYGLNEYDAENLTGDPAFARLFEELMQHTKDADTAANWMLGDFSRQVNDKEIRYDAIPFAMKDLADLLALVENQTIHLNAAKKVLRSMFETGGKPGDIVEKEGLSQITDTGALEKIVDEVLDANPQSIEDIKGGKDRALGFLVGQCMKASKGKGNPQTMRQLLEEKIAQR